MAEKFGFQQIFWICTTLDVALKSPVDTRFEPIYRPGSPGCLPSCNGWPYSGTID